jgi:hypothetical protein
MSGTWLLGNPIEFAMFLGVPVIVALLAGLAARRVRSAAENEKPTSVRPTALIIATFGTLLALIVSGIVRGEVGRLWMYFGPLIALVVAYLMTRHSSLVSAKPPCGTRYSSLVIGLLALQLIVMNTRWLVNDSFLDAPPERSVVVEPPVISMATEYAFGDQIALRGYDAHSTGDQIDLILYWQALTPPPHAYTVFAHVFDANGQSVGQQDNMPVNNQLPTSCWEPGEYVSDPYTIALADGARGPFTIEVGAYRLEPGDRLPLDDRAGTSVRLQVP